MFLGHCNLALKRLKGLKQGEKNSVFALSPCQLLVNKFPHPLQRGWWDGRSFLPSSKLTLKCPEPKKINMRLASNLRSLRIHGSFRFINFHLPTSTGREVEGLEG